MAINVTGQKLIKTLQKEFNEAFPYLQLCLFPLIEKGKKQQTQYSEDLRLSEVRTKTSSGELSIHGRTLVKNLEEKFEKDFGIYAQVCYTDANGNGYYTSGTKDEMSLTQLNKHGEENGWKKNIHR